MRKIFYFILACLFTLPVFSADNPWGYPGDAVGYWAFENTLINIADFGETRGVNHGCAFVEGRDGKAIRLNGTSNSVTLGRPEALEILGKITICAWIKPEHTESSKQGEESIQNIVAKGHSNEPSGEIYLRISNGDYHIGVWNGNNFTADFPIPKKDLGTWVHLAGVYDGTYWRLYRNGEQVSQLKAPVGAVLVNADWAIGSNGEGKSRFFQGAIDEVRIYNRGLTAKEIKKLVGSK